MKLLLALCLFVCGCSGHNKRSSERDHVLQNDVVDTNLIPVLACEYLITNVVGLNSIVFSDMSQSQIRLLQCRLPNYRIESYKRGSLLSVFGLKKANGIPVVFCNEVHIDGNLATAFGGVHYGPATAWRFDLVKSNEWRIKSVKKAFTVD